MTGFGITTGDLQSAQALGACLDAGLQRHLRHVWQPLPCQQGGLQVQGRGGVAALGVSLPDS